jgi:hypothetical protein
VNSPEELTVPAVADQETAWFESLATVAVNCCVPFAAIVALCGESATVTGIAMVREQSAPTTSEPLASLDRTLK